MSDVTQILSRIEAGEPQAATQLQSVIEAELRKLAAQTPVAEQNDPTLHGAALVHEAYRQLVGFSNGDDWLTRGHFFSAAAEALRQLLLEQVRRREGSLGALDSEISFPLENLVEFDRALAELEDLDPQAAAIVKLRVFAGLTTEDSAAILEIPAQEVSRDWSFAEAWVFRLMNKN